MAIHVNADNFVRAETARMFSQLMRAAGGVNVGGHNRAPTPVEDQPVIRMNRDTVMVVNEDHYINRICTSQASTS